MFKDDERMFLSRPVQIFWDGWESNTLKLQQAGWEFSAEQDMTMHGVRLFMRNSRCEMYGSTGYVNMDLFEAHRDPRYLNSMRFQVGHMASRLTAHISDGPIEMAAPVDMQPVMTTWGEIKTLDEFGIFAVPLVRTEGIYLDEASVPKLMETILEAQDPAKKKYFEDKVREQRQPGATSPIGYEPRQKFHAQIISLAA